jgi:hypothetical protein
VTQVLLPPTIQRRDERKIDVSNCHWLGQVAEPGRSWFAAVTERLCGGADGLFWVGGACPQPRLPARRGLAENGLTGGAAPDRTRDQWREKNSAFWGGDPGGHERRSLRHGYLPHGHAEYEGPAASEAQLHIDNQRVDHKLQPGSAAR